MRMSWRVTSVMPMPIKLDKVNKKEKKTYVESMIIFILFLLTLTTMVVAGIGFVIPRLTMESFSTMLTNILLIFLIAEVSVVILSLNRMMQK